MAVEWHYARDGEQHGPFTGRELKAIAARGDLQASDLVWRNGLSDWMPASQIQGLFEASSTKPAPADPEPAASAAAAASEPSATPASRAAAPMAAEDPAVGMSSAVHASQPQTESGFPEPQQIESIGGGQVVDPASVQISSGVVAVGSIPHKFREFIKPGEKVLYASNPSTTARVIQMIVASAGPTVFCLGGMLVGVRQGNVASTIFYLVLGLVLASIACLIAHLQWKHRYYIITDSRTIVSEGIFNVAVRIIFKRNIQMISINTGIIDRFLHLNTVELSTSSGGGGSAIFAFFPWMSGGTVQLRSIANAPRVVALVSD